MEIEMMQHIHVLVDICFRGKCGPIFEFIPHVCRLYSPSPDLFLLPRTCFAVMQLWPNLTVLFDTMDIQAYVDRIGFLDPLPLEKRDFATLAKLQSCHQHNVPWENMDTMTGVKFDLTK